MLRHVKIHSDHPPPTSTHTSPTFHSPLRSLLIPRYSSAYSTSHSSSSSQKSLFIQFCSSVGITHYTLVSSFSTTLVGLFFFLFARGEGSVRLRTNGDLLALLSAFTFFICPFFFLYCFLLFTNPLL